MSCVCVCVCVCVSHLVRRRSSNNQTVTLTLPARTRHQTWRQAEYIAEQAEQAAKVLASKAHSARRKPHRQPALGHGSPDELDNTRALVVQVDTRCLSLTCLVPLASFMCMYVYMHTHVFMYYMYVCITHTHTLSLFCSRSLSRALSLALALSLSLSLSLARSLARSSARALSLPFSPELGELERERAAYGEREQHKERVQHIGREQHTECITRILHGPSELCPDVNFIICCPTCLARDT